MIFKEVGYFSKTHGLKGGLQLNITTDFEIENCKVLIIVENAGQSPQFISEFRETKNGFIILLDEIDSIEKAKRYVGKKVLVDDSFILESDETYLGYKLIDEQFGDLGEIIEVEDTGASLILHINFRNKQVLLPFTEELVVKIDEPSKTIHYKAPEGLIDMYLE